MSDKHTMTLDYQITQARLVKKLTAENSRLRSALLAATGDVAKSANREADARLLERQKAIMICREVGSWLHKQIPHAAGICNVIAATILDQEKPQKIKLTWGKDPKAKKPAKRKRAK